MRIYKFLNAKYGLKAIQDRRLKVSRFANLNDPFDLLPFDLSDPVTRSGFLGYKDDLGADTGVLCFSRGWHNPVLWAHYSDNHCGLCLGFDVSDQLCLPVNYISVPHVLTNEILDHALTNTDLEFAEKLLYSKYNHWAYEEEIRISPGLEEPSGQHFFKSFDKDLNLSEVIVGMNNRVTRRKLIRTLGSSCDSFAIKKARPAYNDFRMVEDELHF